MTRISPTNLTYDKYGFPLEPCERCGGSGRHAYCLAYGTMCFQCNGRGRHHTVAAADEYRKWGQAMIEAQTTPVAEVKVGDVILIAVGWATAQRWWKVVEVSVDLAGRISNNLPVPRADFTLTRKGQTETESIDLDSTVRVSRPDIEPDLDEYVARAIKTEASVRKQLEIK